MNELAVLGNPFSKGDENMYFFVIPGEEELKRVRASWRGRLLGVWLCVLGMVANMHGW